MSEAGIANSAVHLTEKLSEFTIGLGESAPQTKSILGSIRVRTGSPDKSVLLKYSAFAPLLGPTVVKDQTLP